LIIGKTKSVEETWNTIKWGPGMFWLKNRAGQMVFKSRIIWQFFDGR